MSNYDTAPVGDAWSLRGHAADESSLTGLCEAEELTPGNAVDQVQVSKNGTKTILASK